MAAAHARQAAADRVGFKAYPTGQCKREYAPAMVWSLFHSIKFLSATLAVLIHWRAITMQQQA
jgi:hypothetical protein